MFLVYAVSYPSPISVLTISHTPSPRRPIVPSSLYSKSVVLLLNILSLSLSCHIDQDGNICRYNDLFHRLL